MALQRLCHYERIGFFPKFSFTDVLILTLLNFISLKIYFPSILWRAHGTYMWYTLVKATNKDLTYILVDMSVRSCISSKWCGIYQMTWHSRGQPLTISCVILDWCPSCITTLYKNQESHAHKKTFNKRKKKSFFVTT